MYFSLLMYDYQKISKLFIHSRDFGCRDLFRCLLPPSDHSLTENPFVKYISFYKGLRVTYVFLCRSSLDF